MAGAFSKTVNNNECKLRLCDNMVDILVKTSTILIAQKI